MKNIKYILLILIVSNLSCKNNQTSKNTEGAIDTKKKIEIQQNRQLQFLFFANGGLIGYFDDGTISSCPRCDLTDESIASLKNKKPYSKFKIVDKVLISEQGDTIPINSMKNNEWAIVNYKTILEELKIKKLNDKEKKIVEVAFSFHKWYIKNTNDLSSKVPTNFVVLEGENDECLIDYEPYFNELRKLGTISNSFMEKERQRTKPCVETILKMKWSEYEQGGEILEGCDDYIFWTRSQEETSRIEFIDLKRNNDIWLVRFQLFTIFDDGTKYYSPYIGVVSVEKEDKKYMITNIEWSEE